MKRILFLFICFTPVFLPQASGAVEIYANGHKYDSLRAYQDSKKTIAQHKLYVLSVENGFISALSNFYQTLGQSDLKTVREISPKELEKAIERAVTRSKGPKLLISGPGGKVRIMTLTK